MAGDAGCGGAGEREVWPHMGAARARVALGALHAEHKDATGGRERERARALARERGATGESEREREARER